MSNYTQEGYDVSLHGFRKGSIDGADNDGYPKNFFFADTIRSVTIAFGSFFSRLHVIRFNSLNEPIKTIQVPIKYAPRMKAFDYRVEVKDGKPYYITLPNITYRLSGVSFDTTRASGFNETRTFYQKYFEMNGITTKMAEPFWRDIHPLPYNFQMEMEATVEHMSDANQILEQVMSKFEPSSHINIREFWFADIRRSLKITCESSTITYNQDFSEDTKREITVSFQFNIEGFIYKPIERGVVIEKIITKLYTGKELESVNTKYGNYDFSLTDRFNYSEIFGTKIDYAYKLDTNSLIPSFNSDTGTYTTRFKYTPTKEITNYPAGSKRIYVILTVLDSNKEKYNSLFDGEVLNNERCKELFYNTEEDGDLEFSYEIEYKEDIGDGGFILKVYEDLGGYGDKITDNWDFIYKHEGLVGMITESK